jgi:cell division protein FtsB
MVMRGFPDYRARARFRRFLFSKTVAVLLFALFLFFAQAAWGMYEKYVIAGEKRDAALSELRGLELREQDLQAAIRRLSDERGVEEELRTRFMVAKEGETVLVVTDPELYENRGNNTIFVPDTPGFLERFFGVDAMNEE